MGEFEVSRREGKVLIESEKRIEDADADGGGRGRLLGQVGDGDMLART